MAAVFLLRWTSPVFHGLCAGLMAALRHQGVTVKALSPGVRVQFDAGCHN